MSKLSRDEATATATDSALVNHLGILSLTSAPMQTRSQQRFKKISSEKHQKQFQFSAGNETLGTNRFNIPLVTYWVALLIFELLTQKASYPVSAEISGMLSSATMQRNIHNRKLFFPQNFGALFTDKMAKGSKYMLMSTFDCVLIKIFTL